MIGVEARNGLQVKWKALENELEQKCGYFSRSRISVFLAQCTPSVIRNKG